MRIDPYLGIISYNKDTMVHIDSIILYYRAISYR